MTQLPERRALLDAARARVLQAQIEKEARLAPLIAKAQEYVVPVVEIFRNDHGLSQGTIRTSSVELQPRLGYVLVELRWVEECKEGPQERGVGVGLDSADLVWAYARIDDAVTLKGFGPEIHLSDPDWREGVTGIMTAFTQQFIRWVRQ